jgi:hypothetical protein
MAGMRPRRTNCRLGERARLVGPVLVLLAIAPACSGSGSGATHAAGPPTTVAGQVAPPVLRADQQHAVAGRAQVTIPEGFLDVEAVAKKPLSQADVHWVRNDGADLPTMLSPCGGAVPSDTDRVGGRQLVLVGPFLWKAERLVVYRDAAAATRALADLRAALTSCAEHEADGVVVRWQTQALTIGDESLYVGAQRFMGHDALDGNYRGIATRVGRAVLINLDFGGRSHVPPPSEVDAYMAGSHAMVDKLRQADWAR